MIYFIGQPSLLESTVYKTSSIQECLDYFKNHTEIQIDTETTGRDCHGDMLLSLQIGDTDNQWVIDLRCTNILNFKELLETKLVIAHNCKFDTKFLKKAGVILDKIYDTMLAECVLFCGYDKFGYSLADVCKRYIGVELDKEVRADFINLRSGEFEDRHVLYAATDVMHLQKIKALQLKAIERYELQYCINLENEALKAFADMEYNGMYLDVNSWNVNTKASVEKLAELEKALDTIVVTDPKLSVKYKPAFVQANFFDFEERELDINYASPKQIKGICKTLGLEVTSTNERALIKLAKEHHFFGKLSEYRKFAKTVSTYGDSFLKYINKNTGRVHTDFWQIKSTGRVSSGSKKMNSANIQNIPSDNKFRNCFKAKPGYKWVSIDYSSQELAIMADLSGEQMFIEALNNNEDLHSKSASLLYGKTITKEDKAERTAAKVITFGLCYGMGVNKLSDSLNITPEEAEELLKKYEAAFPTLMGWLKNAGELAKKRKRSITQDVCKRIRWYPDMEKAVELRDARSDDWKTIFKIEGSTEREGKNHLIQGSAANIGKEALVEIRKLIKDYEKSYGEGVAYLIATVHDQSDCEVRKDVAEQFAQDMKKVMIDAASKYTTKVKMGADLTVTDVWQK